MMAIDQPSSAARRAVARPIPRLAPVMRMAFMGPALVLASGDGDFVPILELAQERGKRVEILSFREATSQSLQDMADRFTALGEVAGIFLPPRTAV